MKKILFTILFLTSLTALSAQLQDSFLLVGSAGTFSALTDSTFRGTVTFQSDQFGSGYLPTGIQTNYKLIDAKGDIFTITAVNSSNFTTANIDVEEDDADRTAPAGIVMVFKVLDSGLYPLPPVNSTGASPIMQARLLTDNAIMSAANDNRLDSISQSGRTFTFNVGDSTYSMQSIDTFFLENGVYKIVIGTDTLSANLDINFGNVLYVSSDGNDNTAVKGDPNKPWARIDSAYANYNKGDVISILKGRYTVNYPVTWSKEKDLFLVIERGAILVVDRVNFFSFSDTINVNIVGGGDIEMDAAGILFRQSGDFPLDFNLNVGTIRHLDSGGTFADIQNVDSVFSINVDKIENFNTLLIIGNNDNSGTSYLEDDNIDVDIGVLTPNAGQILSLGSTRNSNINISIGVYDPLNINAGTEIMSTYSGDDGFSIIDSTRLNINIGSSVLKSRITGFGNDYTVAYQDAFSLFDFDDSVQINDSYFTIQLDNTLIDNISLFNDLEFRPNSSNFSILFNANAKIKNSFPFKILNSNTTSCDNCNVYIDGVYESDSTIVSLTTNNTIRFNFSGKYKTQSDFSPILNLNTNIPINIENATLETNSTQAPIQGASGLVTLSGDVVVFSDSLDTDITYTRKRNLGSNSIADRLAFGAYTIDQNTSSLRLDTLNQFVVVTENSQSYYSLGGNIEIRADSGNVVLNGGPTGELKMQGDSLTASITGAGVSNDGMTGVFVQNDAGETRLTSRLLPQFDTVNVSTANDTIDIDFAFDQTVVVNMNSAPATVDFVVQNPVKGSTLTLVFTSVGSSHTFNFGHTDIQLATKTGWTIDSAAAKVYVLRYNIDGGGDWIIVRDE